MSVSSEKAHARRRRGRGHGACWRSPACTFHPGKAAVVDGTNIPQSRVDDLVLAACGFFKANRERTAAREPGDIDRPTSGTCSPQDLISFQITDKAADACG